MTDIREVQDNKQAQLDLDLEQVIESQVLGRIAEEEVAVDLGTIFRGAVKTALELVLEEVLRDVVGASKWARVGHRKDNYNGSYLRSLLTSMGHIDVRMPRARKAGAPVDVIGAYKRRSAEIDEAITGAYVHGVSTRGMKDVVEALTGKGVSSSTVSRVTKELEAKVEALRTRSLEREYPYLVLDATYVKARWARKVESVPALIAFGVNEDGMRELLAIEVGTEESALTWGDLLQGLIRRGLRGVRLVLSDAHEGIKAAVREKLPEVQHQRCVVHLMRNVGSHVPHRLRERVLGEVSSIFMSETLEDAKNLLAKFKQRWSKELPEAVQCLEGGFPAATQHFAFPKEHHRRIRSTNGLERLNREIKRRTRSIDSFPDRASALRLITAIVLRATESWSKRRYLDMALLAA